MATRTEQNRFYERYILDAISTDGYGVVATTPKQKLQFVKDTFMSEVGSWQVPKIGLQNALAEWLGGLPSAINLPFYNNEILELAKASGSLPQNATDKQEQRVLDNYFNFMANKLIQLFRKYKVR